jgi:hypothetical protein
VSDSEVDRFEHEEQFEVRRSIRRHVLYAEPTPAEYEWARAQCREALLLLLQGAQRLDDSS